MEYSSRVELSYGFLGTQYGEFGDASCDGDSEWELGGVVLVKEVSGSYLIESRKVMGGGGGGSGVGDI